jgi:hypothetical protein
MSTLIQKAKAGFQFSKTVIPELWSGFRYVYDEDKTIQSVQNDISSRFSENSGRFNFIMAVPVVNWETVLVNAAGLYGECHHIEFESRNFFDSKTDWLQFRVDNANKLKNAVHNCYRENDINILFLYISEFHIDPELVNDLKLKNLLIISFNWDDRLHYTSRNKGQSVGISELAKVVDFNLTMAVKPMARYVADGSNVFYWRGSKSFEIKEPLLPKIEFNRVLFFGSNYGYRTEVINYLTCKGLPIDVYGLGWGNDFISYEALVYKIPRYAVNLGISTIGYTKRLSCVKGRDIEVPTVGGLYLTNHNFEISQVYSIGMDILTYKSKEDCYRKACDVLQEPTIFSHIRRNGAKKAQLYSWESRFLFLTELVRNILSVR